MTVVFMRIRHPKRLFGLAAVAGMLLVTQALRSQAPAAPAAVFNQYCIGCHNARLKIGDFVLDPANLADIPAHADTWEKVVRKLRTGAMPPAGSPRPDAATYNATASFIENALDKADAANPNPGTLPMLHRLTRTEYANSIRDLLNLDALPREIDYSMMLPADNVSSGFDNLADLLYMSPTIMERYLDSARKISRLALGDPKAPLLASTYRLSAEHWQDARVEELSFGTRGGIAIHSEFPQDGIYEIKVDVAGGGREQQQLEITIDGEHADSTTVGGGGRGGGKPPEFRIPVKAGPRLIGVTFVERNQARDEGTLRPRMRARGNQPAIASVLVSGPYEAKGPGETPTRERIFVCKPATAADELPCAKKILSTLLRRAYRHPVANDDLDDLLPFYEAGRAEASFDLGIQRALERMLISPQFLFRIEREPANAKPGSSYRISDLELASRLSFALWSSIPDDVLLDAAIAGRLKDPALLEQQVRRMLADPRSEAMVDNFATQWLFLRDVEAKIPDEVLFPDSDETLRMAFRRETELFLDSVLRENRSVLDLLTANYTFLNERLAKHYGVPNVAGSYYRKVTFPEGSPRGGLLGQGGILMLTSYPNRTSPVVRGKWVLENLLNAAPPPPPANVPALKTEEQSGKAMTIREAMVQHRAAPACAGCHARMDPIGFALENFDAIGHWRERDSDQPIDVAGTLPDGTKIQGVAGLKQALVRQPEQFVSTVTEKLLMYSLGRNVQYFDEPVVRSIVRGAARDNYRFAALVVGVTKSEPFQMRKARGN
jgi:mono/diheme cytochrome c family protein